MPTTIPASTSARSSRAPYPFLRARRIAVAIGKPDGPLSAGRAGSGAPAGIAGLGVVGLIVAGSRSRARIGRRISVRAGIWRTTVAGPGEPSRAKAATPARPSYGKVRPCVPGGARSRYRIRRTPATLIPLSFADVPKLGVARVEEPCNANRLVERAHRALHYPASNRSWSARKKFSTRSCRRSRRDSSPRRRGQSSTRRPYATSA